MKPIKSIIFTDSIKQIIMAVLFFLWAAPGHSLVINGKGQEVVLAGVMGQMTAGTILVLGEQHGMAEQANRQRIILQGLRDKGFRVHVGMEFFQYPQQSLLDKYLNGALSEGDFLKQIGWGAGFSFDHYRDQVKFPVGSGFTFALNAPGWLTRKISQGGLANLDPLDLSYLPPLFSLGNNLYRKRFSENLPHDFDAAKLERYFAAQSAWDDTMAFQAIENFNRTRASAGAGQKDILVIIVGAFHVRYGGGLPDRLLARGAQKIVTIALEQEEFFESGSVPGVFAPSSLYGEWADFIWY